MMLLRSTMHSLLSWVSNNGNSIRSIQQLHVDWVLPGLFKGPNRPPLAIFQGDVYVPGTLCRL